MGCVYRWCGRCLPPLGHPKEPRCPPPATPTVQACPGQGPLPRTGLPQGGDGTTALRLQLQLQLQPPPPPVPLLGQRGTWWQRTRWGRGLVPLLLRLQDWMGTVAARRWSKSFWS